MTKNERRVLKQFFLVVSKTMPKHTEVDSVHIEDLKSSGGLKEKTLKARKKVADEFDAYALSSLDLSLEDLIYEAENGDVSKLQTTLMQFFGTMRVTSNCDDEEYTYKTNKKCVYPGIHKLLNKPVTMVI